MVARNRLKRSGKGSSDKSRLKRTSGLLNTGHAYPAKIISMSEARKLGNIDTEPFVVPAIEYAEKNKNAFAGNHFADIGHFKRFVSSLKAGGTESFVGGIYAEPHRIQDEGDIYADTLFVVDPTEGGFAEIVREQPDEFTKVNSEQNVWRLWWD